MSLKFCLDSPPDKIPDKIPKHAPIMQIPTAGSTRV